MKAQHNTWILGTRKTYSQMFADLPQVLLICFPHFPKMSTVIYSIRWPTKCSLLLGVVQCDTIQATSFVFVAMSIFSSFKDFLPLLFFIVFPNGIEKSECCE